MEILFNKDNSITIVDKEGKVLFQQNLHSFKVDNLKQFGFSDEKLSTINSLIEKRKYSFYA